MSLVRPRGDAKIDPTEMVRAHYRTYVDARTDKVRWQDHALITGIPVLAAVACFAGNVLFTSTVSVGLFTALGLLAAVLLGIMLQIAKMAISWAGSNPAQGVNTSFRARYFEELTANSAYASLVSIASAAGFVLASESSGFMLRVASAIGIALALHMVLVLLMVLKRVFAYTKARLIDAEVGMKST